MKKLLLTFSCALVSYFGLCQATTKVDGYRKNNGTYVAPHIRTSQNNTNKDNFSTSSNSNPYTGSTGTKAPDYSQRATTIHNNHDVQTGSKGGQYYLNSKGNKTYVPKAK
ncbi:MAG: hypothetical protein V4543_12365 [Bacteroidota bacterium]